MSITVKRLRIEVPPGLLVPEIENDLTRREFLIGAGSLLVLTPGCGSGEKAANGGEGAFGETRTIEHEFGTTDISGIPERVVALGHIDADLAAALGVQPVGINDYRLAFGPGEVAPWIEPVIESDEVELIDISGGIPIEQVASLSPDVILAQYTGITNEDYELLSELAPTVAYQTGPFSDTWQDISRAAGEALGREEEARSLVEEVEAEIDSVVEAHPQFVDKTFMVANVFGEDQIGVIATEQDPTMQLLIELGFTPSPNLSEVAPRGTGGTTGDLSLERLDLLDNDLLFMNYAVPDAREALESNPLFQQLDVVQRGANIVFELDEWNAFRAPSVLAVPYVLGEITPRIETAIDSDMETTE